MINRKLIIIFFTCARLTASAQEFENKAWIFLSHKQRLSKTLDLLADLQLRSTDQLKKFETILLRAAASYNLAKAHSIALGYAYKGDWDDETGKINFKLEHRIYEQYIFESKLKRTELTVRVRLEQRFVKEDDQFDFSQRARGFISFQIPLVANHDFTKGVYTTLQNEFFINVQNKEAVNNSFFDQNRLMGSIGYRWNSNVDTELGYIYWRKKETDISSNSNLIQLMITTSF